jgi:CheY-like chemotaxis protein
MSKILIIEDEAAIRRVLPKYFLRRVIPQVEDAEDGVQGYEK